MFKSISVTDFKGFHQATLALGPLTLLVGANASGKSNMGDAFRVLHGIGHGYTVAEIFSEKWGEGSVLEWRGIRGGIREAASHGIHTFAIEVRMTILDDLTPREAEYYIEIDTGSRHQSPHVVTEYLIVQGYGKSVFDSRPEKQPHDPGPFFVWVHTPETNRRRKFSLVSQQPILSQLAQHREVAFSVHGIVRAALNTFRSMRFLDLNPEIMRRPSRPSQTELGDQGDNLSSVLQRLTQEPHAKQALLQWVQTLTPMDVVDIDFLEDASGRVVATLVEESNYRTTLNSASDGTLRFLALIAALLGPSPARFSFIEELDTGIHPARLHLLLQLIEQQVIKGATQMVATTHSPQLLRLLSHEILDYAALTYRLPGEPGAHVVRILDIPEAKRLIAHHDVANLLESGWLEDAVEFAQTVETSG